MDEHLGAPALARRLGTWADDGVAAQTALAGRIRALLLDGRLAVGTRVPSERELALALRVGRGTVAAAYERLRESGHLVRRRGSGTWTSLPAGAGGGPVTPFAPSSAPAPGVPEVIDLAHAAPRAPREAMATAGREALEALPAHLDGPGYDLLGLPVLREAIARRLTGQGLPTAPDEVMVTAGAQHAHALVARALVRPGDRVVLEQPTYPNAVDLVRHCSARPVPVAMSEEPGGAAASRGGPGGGRLDRGAFGGGGLDQGAFGQGAFDRGAFGWDVEALAAALRESTPVLAYLVADHQNPTAAVMPEETRAAVVAATRRHGVPLVVDDCLRDLWFDTPPPTPLGAWATAPAGDAPVITLGSLSKTVWGGLRIGWLRAPRAVVRRIAVTRASDDIATPVLEQLVAVSLLGRLDDDILPERRLRYATRRDHLHRALATHLPEWSAPSPTGGLSLWVDLGAARSSALVEAAARHGVALAAGPRFGTGGAFETRLRVPYTPAPDVLDDAVVRLAAAWHSLDRGTGSLTTVV